MNLLNRYESDDFDESFDFDDPEFGEVEETGSSRGFLFKAGVSLLAVMGIAYGANIAFNSGGSGKLEFGQGMKVTAACDTNGGMTITPYAGYVNQAASTGKFTLDSIIFENVDDTCVGNDFTVQIWSNAGADALTSSETGTAGANYVTSNSVSFYFQDSATVVMNSKQFTDIELLTDVTSNEFVNDQSSFQLTFDPDQLSSFADATQVYKITVTTSKH